MVIEELIELEFNDGYYNNKCLIYKDEDGKYVFDYIEFSEEDGPMERETSLIDLIDNSIADNDYFLFHSIRKIKIHNRNILSEMLEAQRFCFLFHEENYNNMFVTNEQEESKLYTIHEKICGEIYMARTYEYKDVSRGKYNKYQEVYVFYINDDNSFSSEDYNNLKDAVMYNIESYSHCRRDLVSALEKNRNDSDEQKQLYELDCDIKELEKLIQ